MKNRMRIFCATLTLWILWVGMGLLGCDGDNGGGDDDDPPVDGGTTDTDTGSDSETSSDSDTGSDSETDTGGGACESMVRLLCEMACDCAEGGDYMYYHGGDHSMGFTSDVEACVAFELDWLCGIAMDFEGCRLQLESAECGVVDEIPGLALPDECRAIIDGWKRLFQRD